MSSANGKGIVLPCGNAKKAKSFGCYYSLLDQRPKTRQKLDWNNREIDGAYILMPSVWQILNLKLMQRPETETFQICWIGLQKIVKSNQVNLFSAEFSRLEPLWAVAFFSFFISFLRFATNCSRCDGISRTTQNGCWHQCIRDICSYRWPHWEIRQKKGKFELCL